MDDDLLIAIAYLNFRHPVTMPVRHGVKFGEELPMRLESRLFLGRTAALWIQRIRLDRRRGPTPGHDLTHTPFRWYALWRKISNKMSISER